MDLYAGDGHDFSWNLNNVSTAISNGYGISIYSTYFTQGANSTIYDAIASNIIALGK